VLVRIVDAARDLVGSEFAALGLLRGGRLARVVHRERDEPLARLLRELPPDHGVLGRPIDDPLPFVTDDLLAHPAAVAAVSAHHPALHAFIGAPVRVDDTTYGTLCVGDPRRGLFSTEDRELVTAVASAAGVALENALLLRRADRRGRWAQVGVVLGHQVLAEDLGPVDAWQGLLTLLVEVAEADGALLITSVPADHGSVHVPAAAGDLAHLVGRHVPAAASLVDVALERGGPIVVADAATDARTRDLVATSPQVASLITAPVVEQGADPDEPRAVLTLTRGREAEAFDELDTEIVDRFATQAATTLALARERRRRERLQRLEDREHLLAALGEQVIQHVLRATLAITAIAHSLEPETQGQLLEQVRYLDTLARTAWSTAFEMDS
jgi:GAF domain-containing protein